MAMINKNTMELPINLNMVDADSLYTTEKVFPDADNCIVDSGDENYQKFKIFCKIKFDTDGYPHELEEGDTEYDSSSMGLIVETCEQLIWACCGGFERYIYQYAGRIFPLGVNKLYILLKGDNFHFQNDRILRAGFNGVSGNDGNTNKGLGGLFTEKSGANYYRHIVGDEEYYLYPYQKNTQITVQGLQITGTTFMQVTSATKVFINNIYFKDCVFTCTTSPGANALAFYAYPLYNGFLYFNNCKLSIHCRVFENTQRFDSTGVYWNSCSRYIEFSDLNENAFPLANRPFNANTTQCSTKVKNFAYGEVSGTNESNGMIANSLNSSWDIECYVVKFQTYNAGDTDILNVCINCDKASRTYRATSNNNLFVHLNVLREIKTLPDREEVYTFGYSSGVTIFCVELPPGSLSATYIPDSSAKQLTVSECKDYNELNKWGFFVNQRVANND